MACRVFFSGYVRRARQGRAFGALLLLVCCLHAETVQLLSIVPEPTPVIKNKTVFFTVDFVFSKCPAECWWYYNAAEKRMVIEFLDCYIVAADSLAMKTHTPVNEIEIRNISTPIVISGQKSQLLMRLKEEMHCSTECTGTSLRVRLWKELSRKQIFIRKSLLPVVMLVTALAAAAVAAGYFITLSQDSR